MTSLEGKVALVTGASRGIGAAVAQALDDAGRQARARVAQRRRSRHRGRGRARMRRARPDDLEALAAETAERHGGIDILVANAGVGAYGPFLDLPADQLEEMIDVNVKGTLYAARAALPHLVKSDAADMITLASEAGRRGLPYEAVYCASKFAQVGFTRAMDHELREQGIRCSNVCPGGVATDFAMGRGRTPGHARAGRDDDLRGRGRGGRVRARRRPRNHRILETAFRPVTEESWG